MYQTINLCKHYGDPAQPVLNHINLNIPKGSLFGLLGPNGAGKTTLLSILVGLIPKSSGQVLVNGEELTHCLEGVRASSGIVPQDLALYPMLSAIDNLNFFADALGLRGAQRRQNLDFAITTTLLDKHVDKKVVHFSGGLKRRLNLAIGLLNQPRILFLDEPTVGIDPQSRQFILKSIQAINQQGVTIIYTSHYMDEVQKICNHVAIIDNGNILIQDEINHLLHSQVANQLQIRFHQTDAEHIQAILSEGHSVHMQDSHTLLINTSIPLSVLQTVAEHLPDPVTAIEHIAYGQQSLEALFLSLTGNDTRDDDVE